MKSIAILEATSLQSRPQATGRKLSLNKETLGSLVDAESRSAAGIRGAQPTPNCPITFQTRFTAHCC